MTTDPRYPGWKNIKTHDQYMRVVDAERAVIAAAKAFIADRTDGILAPWHDLRRAVEALQEAEDGDA